jgi:hypothetical protein
MPVLQIMAGKELTVKVDEGFIGHKSIARYCGALPRTPVLFLRAQEKEPKEGHP